MLTKMGRHITKQSETNKMLFERMEKLSLNSNRTRQSTPTPSSFLWPGILNFKNSASSKHQVGDFISRHAPIFKDGVTPDTGGLASWRDIQHLVWHP